MYYITHHVEALKYGNVTDIVTNLFATLGSGQRLDNRGFFITNYRSPQAHVYCDPQPITCIYEWSDSERFQPFRMLAGCRDVGFKETAQYFIDCIKVTPDSVENILEWKSNIHIVEDVLLNTPTIQDQYTIDDMDKFLVDIAEAKITNAHGSPDVTTGRESVEKRWFFDVQWSDCPQAVELEVQHAWRNYNLSNDTSIWKTIVDEELFEDYPRVYFWLIHKGVPKDEQVYIHWWW